MGAEGGGGCMGRDIENAWSVRTGEKAGKIHAVFWCAVWIRRCSKSQGEGTSGMQGGGGGGTVRYPI